MNTNRLQQLLAFKEQTPDDPFILYALATEYIAGKDDLTAQTYFETLIQTHPEYIGTYYHYGKLLERQNQPEKAITVYQTGIMIARKINDRHAGNELKEALAMLSGDEDEF